MNTILSLILTLAILFGAGAPLPETPDTATVTTFENIVITSGGETVALNPSFKLTAAAGMQELAARFEAEIDGETLLPIFGVLTPEKLDYALTDSDHYISVSDAVLEGYFSDIGGLFTQEDEEMMDSMLQVSASLMEALELAVSPEMDAWKMNEILTEALAERSNAVPQETTMQVNGAEYPARKYNINVHDGGFYAAYDALLSCDDPVIARYARLMLDSYAAMDGAEYENYAQYVQPSEELQEITNELEYTSCTGDGWRAMHSASKVTGPDGQMTSNGSTSHVFYDDGTFDADASIEMNIEGVGMRMELSGKGMDFPSRWSADFSLGINFQDTEYAMEGTELVEAAAEESYFVDGTLAVREDGWTLNVQYGETPEVLSGSASLSVNSVPQDDGSTTHSWALSLPEEGFALSFDANVATAPYEGFFAGKEEKALSLSSDSAANTQMTIDVLALAADAASLAADDSMMDFSRMLEKFIPDPVTLIESGSYVEYPPAYSYVSVTDLAEARRHFHGETPEFTPPAGFELDEIYIDTEDDSYLNLIYTDGEREIDFVLYSTESDHNYTDDAYYRIGPDGSLRKIREPLAYISINSDSFMGEGYDAYAYADVYTEDTIYIFYLYGFSDMEEIEAIVSGLRV